MTEPSASKPIHPIAAFVLGIAGFLSFAALAIVAFFFFRGATVDDYLTEKSDERIADRVAVDANAAAILDDTKWVDEANGIVQPALADYLPVFGAQLVATKPSVHTPPVTEEAPVAEPVAPAADPVPAEAAPQDEAAPAESDESAPEAGAEMGAVVGAIIGGKTGSAQEEVPAAEVPAAESIPATPLTPATPAN